MKVYDIVMLIYKYSNNSQRRVVIQCTTTSVLGVSIGHFISLDFQDERLLEVYECDVKGLFVQDNQVAIEI